jgi:hypothetical protein
MSGEKSLNSSIAEIFLRSLESFKRCSSSVPLLPRDWKSSRDRYKHATYKSISKSLSLEEEILIWKILKRSISNESAYRVIDVVLEGRVLDL